MVLQNYRNFSMCDDFNKVFGKTVEQNAITGSEKPKKRRKYYRDGINGFPNRRTFYE